MPSSLDSLQAASVAAWAEVTDILHTNVDTIDHHELIERVRRLQSLVRRVESTAPVDLSSDHEQLSEASSRLWKWARQHQETLNRNAPEVIAAVRKCCCDLISSALSARYASVGRSWMTASDHAHLLTLLLTTGQATTAAAQRVKDKATSIIADIDVDGLYALAQESILTMKARQEKVDPVMEWQIYHARADWVMHQQRIDDAYEIFASAINTLFKPNAAALREKALDAHRSIKSHAMAMADLQDPSGAIAQQQIKWLQLVTRQSDKAHHASVELDCLRG